MKTRVPLFAGAVLWLGCTAAAAAQQAGSAPPDHLVVNINAQQTMDPVSKDEFGMFIEHIGPVIYRSLWSEMLDDRKFYFPISSNAPESESQTPGGPSRGRQLRHWRPVGPDGAIVMQRDQAFVGEQSPRIQMDGSSPHGVRQSGLGLVKGKNYNGRIYLRGTPGSKVTSASFGDRTRVIVRPFQLRT